MIPRVALCLESRGGVCEINDLVDTFSLGVFIILLLFFSRVSSGGTFRRNYTIYSRSATSAGGIEYIVDGGGGGGIRSRSRQVYNMYALQPPNGWVPRFSSFNQRTSLSKLKQKTRYLYTKIIILSAYCIYITVFRVAQ